MSTRTGINVLALVLLFLVAAATAQTLSGTQLEITGAGPHAIGGATFSTVQLAIRGTFAERIGVYLPGRYQPPAGVDGFGMQLSPTIDIAGSGVHTDFATLRVDPPMITAGAGSLTNASTLKILGAPFGATNNYALWVADGGFRFDGVGPHAIGGATFSTVQLAVRGTFAERIGVYLPGRYQPPAGADGFGMQLSPTIDIAGSGVHTDFATLRVDPPVITAGAGSLTNASTLKILGASAGATNNYALWVAGGTTLLGGTLHVAGDARIDGNIAAKYQDLAEWVRSDGGLPAGTVVIIDSREPNRVTISDKAYDTRVAGVVSPKPGLLLGEAGEDKAKIAHSGRVKVKVDASYGPIAVGDLLVTSPIPGHAMRSEPIDVGGAKLHRPGTLVGKVLEPLEKGQGEILVLLTLQ